MVKVHGKAEAERIRDELREQRRPSGPVGKAEEVEKPSGEGAAAIVADGADRIELDYTEIAEALKALDERQRVLEAHLADARELGAPLADGKGPVSVPMRRSFARRGGAEEGGVQVALESYLAELAAFRAAIGLVAEQHGRTDEAAASTVDAVARGNDER
ncbi:hypothetical protein [Amycolatopsis pittospori]|uniref:hypothetical protein n=1 Tax=Amycolatopsis pittospori TaxID=2749434 RepID=UPI0015F0228F|nr:hypothetical protein [Amycolatopsis pittospori]